MKTCICILYQCILTCNNFDKLYQCLITFNKLNTMISCYIQIKPIICSVKHRTSRQQKQPNISTNYPNISALQDAQTMFIVDKYFHKNMHVRLIVNSQHKKHFNTSLHNIHNHITKNYGSVPIFHKPIGILYA